MLKSGRRYKTTIYEMLTRIGKAVASPRRLELLDLLCQAPRTVEELARQANLSVANTSQHLQIMRSARLVESEKVGLYVTYRVANDQVGEFFRSLQHLAQSRLAEIDRLTHDYLQEKGQLEAVDRSALIERVRSGDVTVLDVRPPEEFRAAHIPGALSVPLSELESRLADLPREREIVAYCRGPYCVLAIEAVARLRANGFDAVRLEEGVPDWRARGFEVEVGYEGSQ